MKSEVHILGIRHHGPGSARSVLAALEAIQPQAVLVEGPPDADALIPLAAHAEMSPPVALLLYRPDEPKRGVFYPFAAFSPEWQAIRWALAHEVLVRFMDLAQKHELALAAEARAEAPASEDETRARQDPFGLFAEAAGFSDHERWWEEQFEKRHSGPETFAAVLELISTLREEHRDDPRDLRREAAMRQILRETQKQGHERIAVVCGAWHGPALATLPPAKADAELLRGLPKVNVAATWLPWTHRRLTFASGYGAGIHSPGYYQHLWRQAASESLATSWMTRVAHLLRAQDLEGSTASIIEATRLAETTAALRGCAVPGLNEFNEAAQAVFCFGDRAPLALIRERLIVDQILGTVPAEAPQVPLQHDFQKESKRLRLPPEALDKTLELDLRKPNDLERSHLLHRLRLLGVEWGQPVGTRGKGTFKEGWKLRWEPELEVTLIEHAPWGNTVLEAATQFTIEQAARSTELAAVTPLIGRLLLAELPGAVDPVVRQIQNQAALTSDVGQLMNALPPLAAVLRYGNVRQTDASMVGQIVDGLVARICVGLPAACGALAEEAAEEMVKHIDAVHTALATLGLEHLRTPWLAALQALAADDALHGKLSGRCTRLLLDETAIDIESVSARLSRNLSRAVEPAHAAAWVEGFLAGSGLLLLHHTALWSLLDQWLSALTDEHFMQVLPLLRRTFSTFAPPERRQMGELARRGESPAPVVALTEDEIDETRANRLLPTFALLLPRP